MTDRYDDETRTLAARLATWCAENNETVMIDASVTPAVAVKLMAMLGHKISSERTLERWSDRLPSKRGVGCKRYALLDIATAMLAYDTPPDSA